MLVKRRDSESDCRGRFREDKVDMAKTGLFEPQMLGPDAWRHIRKVYRIIVCRRVVGMIVDALSQSPAAFPTPDKGDEASEMEPKDLIRNKLSISEELFCNSNPLSTSL